MLPEMLLKLYVYDMKEVLNICVIYQPAGIVTMIFLHKVVKLKVSIMQGILGATRVFKGRCELSPRLYCFLCFGSDCGHFDIKGLCL